VASSSRPTLSSSKPDAPRPNKKFRLDEDAGEEYDEDSYEDRGKASSSSAATAAAATAKGTKQIISSLFSYKDGSRMTNAEDALEPASSTSLIPASNAVLTSTPSNTTDNTSFPGLGLDPLLVHHLASKLSITHPTQIQRASLSSMLDPIFTQEQRDVFIQSQTGSGKTLTYLLPIIQDLLPLSQLSYIDRSIGTLAIVLVPTRELAKQISDVLESLLNLHLSLPTSNEDPDSTEQPNQTRRTRWIVPGLLTGGSTRAHEKARIRKGLPILVSTPGRLLDHLQNTTSFDVGKLRWLVLDEADRLMDLGFEETVNGILKGLEGRRKLALESLRSGAVMPGGIGGWDWSRERKTVLCSATVREDVQKLAGTALRRPVVFRATDVSALKDAPKLVSVEAGKEKAKVEKKTKEGGTDLAEVVEEEEEKFTPPSQLAQKHIVVPPKLRLVTLVALLRSLLSKKNQSNATAGGSKEGMKVIVFLSTTDSVDFHWKMLGGVGMGGEKEEEGEESEGDDEEAAEDAEDMEGGDSDEEEIRAMIKAAKAAESKKEDVMDEDEPDDATSAAADGKKKKKAKPKSAAQKAAQLIKDEPISFTSTLLPNTTIHRLHGSLPLQTRLASLKSFASTTPPPPSTDPSKPTPPPQSSILFCTSVASRGLDLPTVRAVVQYDLPTEGGATEYVHRVGRTARVGRGGEAWSFVGTGPEKDWVGWIEGKMGEGVKVNGVGVDGVLKKGFGGESVWEGRATEVQGAFERWVLSKTKVGWLASLIMSFGLLIGRSETNAILACLFFLSFFAIGHESFLFARTPTSPKRPTNPTFDPTQPTRLKRNVSSISRTSTSVISPNPLLSETRPRPFPRPPPKRSFPTRPGQLGPSGSGTTTRARWTRRSGCRRLLGRRDG
jgi:ATP-dependent RNA helicase DDX31/DBP7